MKMNLLQFILKNLPKLFSMAVLKIKHQIASHQSLQIQILIQSTKNKSESYLKTKTNYTKQNFFDR